MPRVAYSSHKIHTRIAPRLLVFENSIRIIRCDSEVYTSVKANAADSEHLNNIYKTIQLLLQ
jgi:hypothetical protein